MKKIFVGIDPDCEKSGVAYYETWTRMLEMSNLSFFQLFDYLVWCKANAINDVEFIVVIEGGWLNKSNWHAIKGSAAVNANIGQRVGANHETGKKIVEMCQYLQINYEIVKPTRAKINAETFRHITGTIGRTNQEQRDAAMLVYGRK